MAAPKPIAPNRSPALSLPLRHFCMGIGSFTLGLLGLAIEGPAVLTAAWSPHLLAIVHLLTLEWVLSMIMGASYQFVPVVLHTEIASEALAKGGFWLYALGTGGMVAGFRLFEPRVLVVGASAVVLAIALYLANLGLALRRARNWTMQGSYMVTALGFLVLAAVLGWLRARGLSDPSVAHGLAGGLVAHVQVAAVGFVSLLIFGISYRLVPMFAVAHGLARLEKAVLLVTSLGVLVFATGNLLGQSSMAKLGAVGTAAGVALWGLDMGRVYQGRTRRKLDPGLSYAAIAIIYLMIATMMGLSLAFGWLPHGMVSDRWAIAYGLIGLIGWISFSIVGQFHRIMPFLAWHHRYGKHAGKKKTPLLKDLSDERVGWVGFLAAQVGLVLTVGGVLSGQPMAVRLGSCLLLLCPLSASMMMGQTLVR